MISRASSSSSNSEHNLGEALTSHVLDAISASVAFGQSTGVELLVTCLFDRVTTTVAQVVFVAALVEIESIDLQVEIVSVRATPVRCLVVVSVL